MGERETMGCLRAECPRPCERERGAWRQAVLPPGRRQQAQVLILALTSEEGTTQNALKPRPKSGLDYSLASGKPSDRAPTPLVRSLRGQALSRANMAHVRQSSPDSGLSGKSPVGGRRTDRGCCWPFASPALPHPLETCLVVSGLENPVGVSGLDHPKTSSRVRKLIWGRGLFEGFGRPFEPLSSTTTSR